MSLLSTTSSLAQFTVVGDLPANEDLFQWLSFSLNQHRFTSIAEIPEERSAGWVELDNPEATSFETPDSCWREKYICFSLRQDKRRIPSAVLRSEVQKSEAVWLAEHPGLRRTPKKVREEIKERVRQILLLKTLPSPSVWDVLWDTETGVLTFTTNTASAIDLLESLFKKTFPSLRLRILTPYHRAENVIGTDPLAINLVDADKGSESITSKITENRWIGQDFLLWLLYQQFQGGEVSETWIDNRIILSGSDGKQRVTIIGDQERPATLLAALRDGKVIEDAVIHIVREEMEWKFMLKGELFFFGSFRTPSVRIERDAATDEKSERIAVFYEKVFLLQKGFELFHAVFLQFLKERLSKAWGERQESIRTWLEG